MAQVTSSTLPDSVSQVLGLLEAFRAFDSDNDGFITLPELGGILASLGYKATEQDVNAMMREGDKDKDGLLSLKEFLEMNTKTMDVAVGGLMGTLKSVLEDLDFNCSENVTAEDLFVTIESSGAEGISLEECGQVIAAMDVDGDGAVNFQDFKLIVSSLMQD